jgi:hypothetical protein
MPGEMEKFFGVVEEKSETNKTVSFYCTFTARLLKCLIYNGAGEGNRTLVIIQ